MQHTTNARLPGEDFKAYRARLRTVSAGIKRYLRGTMVCATASAVTLPLPGVDSQADEAVLRGQFRDVALLTLPDGKQIRVARTKGVTYRKPAAP